MPSSSPDHAFGGAPWMASLLVCASVAAALQGAALAHPQPVQEADAALERDLSRVLHLAGGGTWRGRARLREGRWEIREGGAWRQLPAGAVARAVEERRLLARAAELQRDVQGGAAARRVLLADWMLREGLLEEALEQLDRVLAEDPDQTEALALLREPPARLRVPGEDGDLDEALRAAAGAPPALRELVLLRLEERVGAEALRARLERELRSHASRLRAVAALGLRRLIERTPLERLAVQGLIARAVLDGSEEVRRQASLTLRDVQQEAVILPVVRALASPSPAVRGNAAQALGAMAYPAAVEPLVSRLATLRAPQGSASAGAPRSHIFVGRQFAYIQDFDVEVAQGAAVADPVVNTLVEGSVLDVRVIGTSVQPIASERRIVRRALAQLTGEQLDDDEAWLAWWDRNRHRYLADGRDPASAAAPQTPGGSPDGAQR